MERHWRIAVGLLAMVLSLAVGATGCTVSGLSASDPRVREINEYALWAIERGLWREARASLEQAVAYSPDHAGLHNNLGIVYEFFGDTLSAEQSYQRALGLLPSSKEIRHNYEEFVKYKAEFKEYDVSVQGLRTVGEALRRWGKSRTFRFEIKKKPLVSLKGLRRLGIVSYQKARRKPLSRRDDFPGKMADMMRYVLRRDESLTLIPDHEMRWALDVDRWDSTSVKLENLARIRDKLDLDGLLILETEESRTRLVPGGTAGVIVTDRNVEVQARQPRLSVQLKMTMRIVRLDSLKTIWEKSFQEAVTFQMSPALGVPLVGGGVSTEAIEEMSESIAHEFGYYLEPGAFEAEKKFLLF